MDPNIPVGRKQNGPFHLNPDRNFRNLWHNQKVLKFSENAWTRMARSETTETNYKFLLLLFPRSRTGLRIISLENQQKRGRIGQSDRAG